MAKKPFPFKVCEQCCDGSNTGGGGADGASTRFIVNITYDSNNAPVSDKTFAEIKTAYDEDKDVMAVVSGRDIYCLGSVTLNAVVFSGTNAANNEIVTITIMADDNISKTATRLQSIENKVKKITDEVTHSEYPSALAVKNYVDETFLGGAW